ncbi:MAG: S-layer homology domain-containing protein, partial [Clostridia bacterium]|nr:S-layer homology domain-containing protein [Clostridia bacterium]
MKRLISALLCAVLVCAFIPTAVLGADTGLPFTDVKKTAWFYEQVKYVYDNGIMNGTSSDKFGPNGSMSRAMFVTTLGRISGAETIETTKFKDVKKNSWYSGYVGWAVENDIVGGYEDGTFKPNNPIRRQEVAALISRYMAYRGVIFDWNRDVPSDFADADKIPSWAAYNIEELVKSGIVLGDAQGNFNPKKNITRAEAATILMRLNDAEKLAFSDEVYLSACDLMTNEGLFLSNFNSALDESGEYPVMTLTPHEYFAAPWFFGIDFMAGDFSYSSLGYMKVCYKSDADGEPYLNITSRPYSKTEIKPIKTGTEGEFKTAVFEVKDFILEYQKAYLGDVNTYGDGKYKYGCPALDDLDVRLLDSTYLKFLVYPFGDAASVNASLEYICFFADKDTALGYKASDTKNYYTSGEYLYGKADINDISQSDYEAEVKSVFDRKTEIENSESELTPKDIKGTCYYISSIRGVKGNDGLSPEKPAKCIYDLYTYRAGGTIMVSPFKSGDGVFFERGSVFYPDERDTSNYSGYGSLITEEGVSYGAYGTGAKPIFTSALDVNGSKNWEATEYENVYKLTDTKRLCGKNTMDGEFVPGVQDAGNITIFDKDGNEGFGVKVSPYDPCNPYQPGKLTWGIGENTSNGFETFESTNNPCDNPGTILQHNLEFFHDYDAATVYMYCDKGNPAVVYDKVIVTTRGRGIHGSSNHVWLDNIVAEYLGVHGFDITDGNYYRMTNCEMKWIGGCYEATERNGFQDESGEVTKIPSRLGNGFQNWQNLNHVSLENCLFYGIYDGACSTQVAWADFSYVNGFYVDGCVFIDSNSPIEIWNLALTDVTANVYIRNNMFYNRDMDKRFGTQRMTGSGIRCEGGTFIAGSAPATIHCERFIVENTLFLMNNSDLYRNS